MRLTNKTPKYEYYNERWEGKKKNYNVKINYTAHPTNKEKPYWYYILNKGEYRYNSLWNGLKYASKENCVCAAEEKIEELEKV